MTAREDRLTGNCACREVEIPEGCKMVVVMPPDNEIELGVSNIVAHGRKHCGILELTLPRKDES